MFSSPLENSQVSGTIAAVEYDKVTPQVTTGDAVRSPDRQLLDAEWGLFDDTRHTVFPTSSAISNPPVRSTAKPTGLPRA